MDGYFEQDPVDWVHGQLADDRLRARWRDQRPPADVVPADRTPTDWPALARAAREGGLTFTHVELTEDGAVSVTESVTIVLPNWDNPK